MIKLIIFDLDGTLIDSRRDIADAVNWTLREFGFSELPIERVSSFVGNGVRNLMMQALREVGVADGKLERSIKLFRRRYGEHLLDHTCLYPGVVKVLEFFKHRKQAVITNKPEDFSRTILTGLGIDSYFFQILGGDQGFPKKPAPDTVLEVLRRASIASNEAVLVGDSAMDVETGKNAGVKTIAVTYGFGKQKEVENASPNLIINQLEELIQCPLLQIP